MIYPIECSDNFCVEGIKDADDLAQWLNSWLADKDSTKCVITKVSETNQTYDHEQFTLSAKHTDLHIL